MATKTSRGLPVPARLRRGVEEAASRTRPERRSRRRPPSGPILSPVGARRSGDRPRGASRSSRSCRSGSTRPVRAGRGIAWLLAGAFGVGAVRLPGDRRLVGRRAPARHRRRGPRADVHRVRGARRRRPRSRVALRGNPASLERRRQVLAEAGGLVGALAAWPLGTRAVADRRRDRVRGVRRARVADLHGHARSPP